jgi:alkylation response protein AidB-like acyl-CoA dehydrogenase
MNAIGPNPVALLKERIAGLTPIVAAARADMERDRRMPEPLFRAIAEAGLLRLWRPHAFGGWELSLHGFMEVVEAASALEGAIGWTVGNLGGMSRALGYLSPAAVAALFSDPDSAIVATNGRIGEAVPVPGGYSVSGCWPFASGIHHATHVAAACRVTDGPGEGTLLLVYVEARHATIIDNWYTSGMRGTGSSDYTLTDVFVPAEHTHDMLNPPAIQPGLLYRLPHISIFATTVSCVPLGIARAALDTFILSLSTRARHGTSAPLRERELIQSELGRAEMLYAGGRALLRAKMDELEAATVDGGPRLILARVDYRAACTHAAETALSVVTRLASMAGTSAIMESSPLERQIRDIQAAVRHIACSPNNYVVAGRVHLGLEPGVARF